MPSPADENAPVIYVRHLPPQLKAKLIASAKAKGVTLNAYVVSILVEHEARGGGRRGAQLQTRT